MHPKFGYLELPKHWSPFNSLYVWKSWGLLGFPMFYCWLIHTILNVVCIHCSFLHEQYEGGGDWGTARESTTKQTTSTYPHTDSDFQSRIPIPNLKKWGALRKSAIYPPKPSVCTNFPWCFTPSFHIRSILSPCLWAQSGHLSVIPSCQSKRRRLDHGHENGRHLFGQSSFGHLLWQTCAQCRGRSYLRKCSERW